MSYGRRYLSHVKKKRNKGLLDKRQDALANNPEDQKQLYRRLHHLFCKVGYNGTRVNLNIRRLVYKMFVDNKLDEQDKTYWVVSVKDGNGLNCEPTNLELISVAERMNRSLIIREERNILPAYRTSEKNRKKGIKKMARTHWVNVKQYTIQGKYIATYSSITKATKASGVNGSNIVACAKGKRKQAGGYVWRYEGDEYIPAD
jgi:hypothetical protein